MRTLIAAPVQSSLGHFGRILMPSGIAGGACYCRGTQNLCLPQKIDSTGSISPSLIGGTSNVRFEPPHFYILDSISSSANVAVIANVRDRPITHSRSKRIGERSPVASPSCGPSVEALSKKIPHPPIFQPSVGQSITVKPTNGLISI